MLNVMIVDDEPIIREGLRYMIQKGSSIPVQISMADSGEGAIRLLQETNPSVMLVDLNMPAMDGFCLIDQVRQLRPDMRFIVITGHDEYEYAVRALRMRVVDYLSKPIDAERLFNLLATIDQEIAQQRARFERRILRDLQMHLLYQEPLCDLESEPREIEAMLNCPYLTMVLTYRGDEPSGYDESILKEILPSDARMHAFFAKDSIVHLINTQAPLESPWLTRALYERENALSMTLFAASSPTHEAVNTLLMTYHELWKNMLVMLLGSKELLGQRLHQLQPIGKEINFSALSCALRSNSEQVIRCELNRISETSRDSSSDAYLTYLNICACAAVISRPWMLGHQIPLDKDFLRALQTQDSVTQDNLFENSVKFVCGEMNFFSQQPEVAYSPNVRAACEYIKKHLRNVRSIDQIAQHVHLHPNYLSSMFRHEVGVSMVKYINNFRILEAQRLLSEKFELPIEEIAEKVGFQTVRYFYRAFREKTGMTPGEYRKSAMIQNL